MFGQKFQSCLNASRIFGQMFFYRDFCLRSTFTREQLLDMSKCKINVTVCQIVILVGTFYAMDKVKLIHVCPTGVDIINGPKC